jgi:hypothetical protein
MPSLTDGVIRQAIKRVPSAAQSSHGTPANVPKSVTWNLSIDATRSSISTLPFPRAFAIFCKPAALRAGRAEVSVAG